MKNNTIVRNISAPNDGADGNRIFHVAVEDNSFDAPLMHFTMMEMIGQKFCFRTALVVPNVTFIPVILNDCGDIIAPDLSFKGSCNVSRAKNAAVRWCKVVARTEALVDIESNDMDMVYVIKAMAGTGKASASLKGFLEDYNLQKANSSTYKRQCGNLERELEQMREELVGLRSDVLNLKSVIREMEFEQEVDEIEMEIKHDTYSLYVLNDSGSQRKIPLIRLLREDYGIDLGEAKPLVSQVMHRFGALMVGMDEKAKDDLQFKLQELGYQTRIEVTK